MYKLYYSPGACSMAIHALLNELGQPVEIIKKSDVADYLKINPTNAIPALDDNGIILREGAAMALYLMEKHKGMLPSEPKEKANSLNWLLFANASLHPAYSKMFFINKKIEDKAAQEQALKAARDSVVKLWKIADDQLAKTPYITGDKISAADFMLAVYANWNGYFNIDIPMGSNVKRLIKDVSSKPSFQKALKEEQVEYKAAA